VASTGPGPTSSASSFTTGYTAGQVRLRSLQSTWTPDSPNARHQPQSGGDIRLGCYSPR